MLDGDRQSCKSVRTQEQGAGGGLEGGCSRLEEWVGGAANWVDL